MTFAIHLRSTGKRIVAFALCALIPLLLVFWGVFSIFEVGQIVDGFAVLFWFLLPLISLGLLALILFADTPHRGLLRAMVVTLLLIGLVALCLYYFLFGPLELFQRYENGEALELKDYYQEEVDGFPHMPDMLALGEAEHIVFCSYYRQVAIFRSSSCMLMVRYDRAEYDTRVAALPEQFVFQEGPFREGCTVAPSAEVNGYFFRVLSVAGEYEGVYRYPYKLMLVGTNDTTCEIVYLAFEDGDLDYIEDLSTFLLEDCGFRHVK